MHCAKLSAYAVIFMILLQTIVTNNIEKKSSYSDFGDDCYDVYLSDSGKLKAKCGKISVKKNLDKCFTNSNGILKFMRKGKFSKSCKDCDLEKHKNKYYLECKCKNMYLKKKSTKILLNDYIYFKNYKLKCKEPYGPDDTDDDEDEEDEDNSTYKKPKSQKDSKIDDTEDDDHPKKPKPSKTKVVKESISKTTEITKRKKPITPKPEDSEEFQSKEPKEPEVKVEDDDQIDTKCKSAIMENHFLSSYCGSNKIHLVLDLNKCVTNNNGKIEYRQDGAFSATCTKCKIVYEGDISKLSCQCENSEGDPEKTKINLDNIVEYKNYQLKCRNKPEVIISKDDDNRRKIEEENKRKIDEENRIKIEEDNKRKIEEENRRKIEIENKQKLEEENNRKIEEENKRKLAEENTRKIDEENKRKIEEENKRKLEEENRRRIEEENKRKLEEENTRKIEEENKRKIEEENRRKIEEENRRKLAEENKRKIEEENKRKLDFNEHLTGSDNFKIFCSQFNVVNSRYLEAKCVKNQIPEKLDLDECFTNNNGKLFFKENGNFSKSCKDCSIEDDSEKDGNYVMKCECKDLQGNYANTTINLKERIVIDHNKNIIKCLPNLQLLDDDEDEKCKN